MALLSGKAAYVVVGVAAGASAKWLAPLILPAVAAIVKPVTKATLKLGWIGAEYAREFAQGLVEVIEDAVAEARQELESSAALAKPEQKREAA